jgi:hypothetical protein
VGVGPEQDDLVRLELFGHLPRKATYDSHRHFGPAVPRFGLRLGSTGLVHEPILHVDGDFSIVGTRSGPVNSTPLPWPRYVVKKNRGQVVSIYRSPRRSSPQRLQWENSAGARRHQGQSA